MGTRFGLNGLAASQGRRLEHLDHAGVPDRDIQAVQARVEEDDVRNTGDRVRGQDLSRIRVDRRQDAGVTGTEQSAAGDVDVEAMRTGVRDGDDSTDVYRIAGFDHDDLRWVRDVDMKGIADRIVDRPARAPGHGDIGDALASADVDHGDRKGTGDGRVTHVRDEQAGPAG